jgi:hypothetical protein
MDIEMSDLSHKQRPNTSSPTFEPFEIEEPEPAVRARPSTMTRLLSSAKGLRDRVTGFGQDATNTVKAKLANPGVEAPQLDPGSNAPAELQQDGITSPLDSRVSSIRANMDMASTTGEAGRTLRSGAIDVQNAASSTAATIGGKVIGAISGFNPRQTVQSTGAIGEASGNLMMASDSSVTASYKMAQIRNRNAAREASSASAALAKGKAEGASPEELSRLKKARYRALLRRVPANNNLAAHGVVARNMPMPELSTKQTDDVNAGSAVAPSQVGKLSRFGQMLRSFGKGASKTGDVVQGKNATKYIDQGDDATAIAAGTSSVAQQIAGATQVGRPVTAAIHAKGKVISGVGTAATMVGGKLAEKADASDLQESMSTGAYRSDAVDKGVYLKGAERKKPEGLLNKAKTWIYDKLFGSSKRKK